MVFLGVCPLGIDFDASDQNPTHLIFLVAIPENKDTSYLRFLSQVVRVFSNRQVREQVVMATSPHEILRIIQEVEAQPA